jgi:hypothetical protein
MVESDSPFPANSESTEIDEDEASESLAPDRIMPNGPNSSRLSCSMINGIASLNAP